MNCTHSTAAARLSLLALLLLLHAAGAAELVVTSPRDFDVVQRATPGKGTLPLAAQLSEDAPGDAVVETRLVGGNADAAWHRLDAKVAGRAISGLLEAPAGGWWLLEVRVSHAGKVLATGGVEHVGVGEVFVVAGQSNSANYGAEKQTPQTGRVAVFDGTNWQLANDPQPGAGGKGGSFMPPLGDALVKKFDVPIGFVACGIGATSVREWLPKGAAFPNPPTLTSRVEQLADGKWASKGAAFEMFVARMKALGPHGFRAVLWHQGESDANQKDPTRTLPGKLYREHLEQLIRESRRVIGWDAPWFVAQASYHVPGDEGSDDIRAAQASLWRDGLALAGPDSDALKGDLRERNGQGVHFSGKGLREHAAKWAEKIVPWLERQSTAPRAAGSSADRDDAAWLRTKGTLLFYDAFEREETGNGAKAIGNGWNSATADRVPHLKQADLDGGILKVASATKEAGHAAHIHHEAGFTDGGVVVRFRFPGLSKGESLQLGFVDRETKGVHAGHLCYGILSPTSVTLIDHKTGVMNLDIRNRRQPFLDRKEPLPADLDALLKTRQIVVPWKADTEWHDIVLVTEGDELRLSLDGKRITAHRSDGFAHPMKRWFSFLVPAAVWIDDVKIWRVK